MSNQDVSPDGGCACDGFLAIIEWVAKQLRRLK